MTYLEQLTIEHKSRLERLNAGPRQSVSFKSEKTPSEIVPEPEPQKKPVQEIPVMSEEQLLHDLEVMESARQLEAARSIGLKGRASEQQFPNEPDPTPRPSVHRIKEVVAAHYGISLLDLDQSRRTATVVRPRQIAMFLACRMTLRSSPFIGRQFAGRDHTTVLHARDKIARLRTQDADLDAELVALEAKLTA